MGINDLFLTPIYLIFIYAFIFFNRSRIKDKTLQKYFLPAVNVKIIGGVSLGLIYQFYYGGGDTFNFYADSGFIWLAFVNSSPIVAFQIIFASANVYHPDIYDYTKYIYYFQDPNTYHVIRLAGFLGLFTFHTYTLIAIGFALLSFSGMWAMYKVFYDLFPHLHRQLAWAVFFIPSVFFWGSGLMKDSITLGASGWLFYAFYFVFIKRKDILRNGVILSLSILIILSIKIYILLCFMPAAFYWIFLEYRTKIKSYAIRAISLPLITIITIPLSFLAFNRIAEENKRYSLDNIAKTTKESADWLKYVADTQGGSAYSLGEFDGTIGNLLLKFPQAVFLAFYRPLIFEVRNPLMLLSALESIVFLLLTFKILVSRNLYKLPKILLEHPVIIFCLIYSIILGFGVALASSNFGTVVRYKIPFLPFFLASLYLIRYYQSGTKKLF